MVLSEKRIHRHIFHHVVHPAHVPLEVKAQSPDIGGLGYIRPSGGFLGDHYSVGYPCKDCPVEHLQKLDRFEVFVPAVFIGTPLAALPVIIEI